MPHEKNLTDALDTIHNIASDLRTKGYAAQADGLERAADDLIDYITFEFGRLELELSKPKSERGHAFSSG